MFRVGQENGGLSFSDLALAPVLAFMWPSESVLFLSPHEWIDAPKGLSLANNTEGEVCGG